VSSGNSPISSRKMVPPFASSNRPRRRCIAPVNAPFRGQRVRKKSAMGQELRSSSSRRRVATDEIVYGWRGRPVPVSPLTRTLESVGATFITRESTPCNADEVPTISSNMNAWSICSLSAAFSFCS